MTGYASCTNIFLHITVSRLFMHRVKSDQNLIAWHQEPITESTYKFLTFELLYIINETMWIAKQVNVIGKGKTIKDSKQILPAKL